MSTNNQLAAAVDALSYGELIAVSDMGIAAAAQAAQAAHAAAYAAWQEAGQPYTGNDTDKDHPHMRLRTAESYLRRISRVARLCRTISASELDVAMAKSFADRHELWELLPAPTATPAAS